MLVLNVILIKQCRYESGILPVQSFCRDVPIISKKGGVKKWSYYFSEDF